MRCWTGALHPRSSQAGACPSAPALSLLTEELRGPLLCCTFRVLFLFLSLSLSREYRQRRCFRFVFPFPHVLSADAVRVICILSPPVSCIDIFCGHPHAVCWNCSPHLLMRLVSSPNNKRQVICLPIFYLLQAPQTSPE